VVAGESSEAGNQGALGMTKRRGYLQGKGRLLEEGAVAGYCYFRVNCSLERLVNAVDTIEAANESPAAR
jgi:hypothetical protein